VGEARDADHVVIILARHCATPHAFDEAMWSKYSARLAEMTRLNDPNTKEPQT
jgi:hypothetical protein